MGTAWVGTVLFGNATVAASLLRQDNDLDREYLLQHHCMLQSVFSGATKY